MTNVLTWPATMPLIGMVFLPIGLGIISYLWDKKSVKYLVFFIQATLFVMSLFYLQVLTETPQMLEQLSKMPLPLGMTLRLDRLSSVMLVLSNLLFWLLLLFNYHKLYMDGRFNFLYLTLQGIINGIFLSNDLFNIYLLVEVATILVCIMIMYKKDAMAMYDGMVYLLVNMVAMAFFVFGIAFIYKHFGRFDLSGIERDMLQVTLVSPLYLPFALMFAAACLKAAVLPLFSWLPKAHSTASAPSIVSAILSGIFVKTGVYLLLRVTQLFDAAIDIDVFVQILGMITAIFGFIFAIVQTDIKAILAYHTISQVGLMLIGFYSGTEAGYSGGLLHLFSHGIFKSLLFIIAGLLIEIYKSRQVTNFGSLLKRSPVVAFALVIAMLSITGAPLFSGSVSKHLISSGYQGLYGGPLFYFISLGTMVSFLKVGFYAFKPIKKERDSILKVTHYPLRWNQIAVLITMGALCILLGQLDGISLNLLTGLDGYGNLWFGEGNTLFRLLGNFLNSGFFVQKIFQYLIVVAVAVPVFKYLIVQRSFVGVVRSIDLSYNIIILMLTIFFVFSLVTISMVGSGFVS